MTGKMRIRKTSLVIFAAANLFLPSSAFAKRSAPIPVPPVVWQGVEYRAPLDVEHMGCVQAFEQSSGRKLWETKVYDVHILPMLEEDVQWVFISSMRVQDGKLLITNEKGKRFQLDMNTGQIDGRISSLLKWCMAGGILLLLGTVLWIRVARRKQVLETGPA
jgi:outer membrane protein assembly factor BamB